MEELEQKLKSLILEQYGSLSKFAEIVDMPWTTLDSVLKRGIKKSNVSNIIKICQELQISADELANGKIVGLSNLRQTGESFPENIRAAARGMMDLSPEDQKTAIDMINYLSQKGKEAKKK